MLLRLLQQIASYILRNLHHILEVSLVRKYYQIQLLLFLKEEIVIIQQLLIRFHFLMLNLSMVLEQLVLSVIHIHFLIIIHPNQYSDQFHRYFYLLQILLLNQQHQMQLLIPIQLLDAHPFQLVPNNLFYSNSNLLLLILVTPIYIQKFLVCLIMIIEVFFSIELYH